MYYSFNGSLKALITLFLILISTNSFADPTAPTFISEEVKVGDEKESKGTTPLIDLKTLYGELVKAPDDVSAEKITLSIEKVWTQSGSSTADLLLQRAIAAANAKDLDSAMYFLNSIIELYPDWPEAYNRRAYLYVLRLDYLQALGDLRRVLSLDTQNFRALEGLVQVLTALGQTKAALDANRELLKVHPFSPGAKETLLKLEGEVKNQGI